MSKVFKLLGIAVSRCENPEHEISSFARLKCWWNQDVTAPWKCGLEKDRPGANEVGCGSLFCHCVQPIAAIGLDSHDVHANDQTVGTFLTLRTLIFLDQICHNGFFFIIYIKAILNTNRRRLFSESHKTWKIKDCKIVGMLCRCISIFKGYKTGMGNLVTYKCHFNFPDIILIQTLDYE